MQWGQFIFQGNEIVQTPREEEKLLLQREAYYYISMPYTLKALEA
jgi:hypothetical protein